MLCHPGHLSQGVQESIIVLTCNKNIQPSSTASPKCDIFWGREMLGSKPSCLTWWNMGAESMAGEVDAKQPKTRYHWLFQYSNPHCPCPCHCLCPCHSCPCMSLSLLLVAFLMFWSTCVLGGSVEPGAQKFQHCRATRVRLVWCINDFHSRGKSQFKETLSISSLPSQMEYYQSNAPVKGWCDKNRIQDGVSMVL